MFKNFNLWPWTFLKFNILVEFKSLYYDTHVNKCKCFELMLHSYYIVYQASVMPQSENEDVDIG